MGKAGTNGDATVVRNLSPPEWRPDAIDQDLLRSASVKLKEKKQLNRQESAVVRKAASVKEEQERWRHYQSIPQKHWARMSGRQWKILKDQAELYGISFADAVIDLTKVVPQIHDFFARHFRKFAIPEDGTEEALAGASKNVKNEYVIQQTRIARLKADEMEKKAVYWDELQPALVDFGTGMRRAGDLLQRRFGPEAAAIINEECEAFDRRLGMMTAGNATTETQRKKERFDPQIAQRVADFQKKNPCKSA